MSSVLLTDLSYEQLVSWLRELGEPAFRARQLFEWVYKLFVFDWDAMTNLPLSLRKRLAERATVLPLTPLESVQSADGLTNKLLFQLLDGATIESVWMGYERRQTICVSSQVGCAMQCPFCATGQAGFERNLAAGEIIAQVLYFAQKLSTCGETVSNVVFMGMGEPLANYDEVWKAITTLNDSRGMGLGARRFTVSTAGIVPGIRQLANERLEVGLAVSLHAANDELRNQLVPVNRRYPLAELMAACREYVQKTGRRVTFEYALTEGLNDQAENARELGRLLQGMLAHVNLIPLNPTANCGGRASSRDRIMGFRRVLNEMGINNTVRLGRGLDISAGCGQLRSRQSSAADLRSEIP